MAKRRCKHDFDNPTLCCSLCGVSLRAFVTRQYANKRRRLRKNEVLTFQRGSVEEAEFLAALGIRL